MAEFFVLRSFRRQALGRTMLAAILARHSGRWHIANQTANSGAAGFWSRAVPPRGSTVSPLRFDGDDWTLRAFTA
jgi:predicted acetyltransferase